MAAIREKAAVLPEINPADGACVLHRRLLLSFIPGATQQLGDNNSSLVFYKVDFQGDVLEVLRTAQKMVQR